LTLNDAAVTQNAAANILNIVNDNGIANATGAVTANGGITIDVRALSAGKNINYDGQETDTGATLTVSATTAAVTAASALANATTMTADRFIFADANINATAVIDGGADRTTVGTGAAGTGSNIGHARNADVLEVRNAAVVSLGDLAGIRNVSSIEFTNDTAAVQTSVLQLSDATVDALVNSTLATVSTDTTTIGNSYEVLHVTALDNAIVTGASTQLNLDGSLIVNAANRISVTGGGGRDTIIGGAGADTITGSAGADALTGGSGADTFIFANSSTSTPSDTNFDTISDYVSATDIIDFAVDIVKFATAVTAASGTAGVTVTTGVTSFNAADSTLALKVTAIAAALSTAAAGNALIFQHSTDSYLYITDGTAGAGTTDVLIKLTGITGAGADEMTLTTGNLTSLG